MLLYASAAVHAIDKSGKRQAKRDARLAFRLPACAHIFRSRLIGLDFRVDKQCVASKEFFSILFRESKDKVLRYMDFLVSIRCSYIPYRRNETVSLEPYYPNRLGRLLGYDQHYPTEIQLPRVDPTLELVYVCWSSIKDFYTGAKFTVPSCERNSVVSQRYLKHLQDHYNAHFSITIGDLTQPKGQEALQAKISGATFSYIHTRVTGRVVSTPPKGSVEGSTSLVGFTLQTMKDLVGDPDIAAVMGNNDSEAGMETEKMTDLMRQALNVFVFTQRQVEPTIQDSEIRNRWVVKLDQDVRVHRQAYEEHKRLKMAQDATDCLRQQKRKIDCHAGDATLMDTAIGATLPLPENKGSSEDSVEVQDNALLDVINSPPSRPLADPSIPMRSPAAVGTSRAVIIHRPATQQETTQRRGRGRPRKIVIREPLPSRSFPPTPQVPTKRPLGPVSSSAPTSPILPSKRKKVSASRSRSTSDMSIFGEEVTEGASTQGTENIYTDNPPIYGSIVDIDTDADRREHVLPSSSTQREVEPNQEFQGLVCEGASVLPAKFLEDKFRDEYGKIVNIRHLDEVIKSINGWYSDRGFFGLVSGVEILSGGILRLEVSEAEVNNIIIWFLDRKTGEPTVGKTRPETILRQLTTKKGQVYSLLQGKRDVETILTMGIMEDVTIIPQPAGDTGKVDLVMNLVERPSGGFSAGGGISSGITSGPLSGLIGSFAYSHRNVFGRNQKLNLSLERGQIDSIFRINYTDPWIEGDNKRTSRSIMIQNSRTPGTLVHGNQRGGVTIGKVSAGIEFSRPLRPMWSGTAGLLFQHAGACDDRGAPIIRDFYNCPLTASGNTYDDMLVAKLESVYTGSGDHGSSMFAFNVEQGLPILPEWLCFNRVTARARQGVEIGSARVLLSLSGGHVVGSFPPHEAFAIGGTNSVRGYEEGALGSGRSYAVGSGELSFPLFGPLEGVLFSDYGSDLGSGPTVPGDPAGARGKPGTGYGYGLGVRIDSPLGPLRLEYALNDRHARRFHFGVGLRN